MKFESSRVRFLAERAEEDSGDGTLFLGCRKGEFRPLTFQLVIATRLASFRALDPAFLVFAGCFALRLIVLARLGASGAPIPPGSDMAFYNEWAHRIAAGQFTDGEAFFGLPGYPYFLAVLYRVFGYSTVIPAIVQIALDSGTAAVIYKIAARMPASVAGATSGVGVARARVRLSCAGGAAAGAWALFLPAQAYSAVLMPTAWLTFAVWWLVWQVLKSNEPAPGRAAFLWGLVIGFAAIFVGTVLSLIPLLLAAAASESSGARKRVVTRLAAIAALLAGVATGTAPCWLHNTVIAGEPVILSTHSGVNFWIGNNREANGYPNFPSELRAGQSDLLHDSRAAAERALGRELSRSAASSYWSARARTFIAHETKALLKLLGTKLRNFWSAFEYDDLGVIARLREEQALLPGFSFGVVAALGLPGLCLASVRFREARWMVAAVLSLMSAVLMVFVTERYRLAIVPGLLIGASYGLAALWRHLLEGRYRSIALYFALTAGATFVVSAAPKRPELWALRFYAAALRALERGDLTHAEEQITRALRVAPQSNDVKYVLANVRLQQGNLSDAQTHYREVLRTDSRHVGALHNLGIIALEQQDFREAERLLREALAHDPDHATRLYLHAHALAGLGERAAAVAALRRALHLRPNEPQFETLLRELE